MGDGDWLPPESTPPDFGIPEKTPTDPTFVNHVFGGLVMLAVVVTVCLLVLHWAGVI